MATLNIGGRKVTVDDEFLQLPPDQQAAVVEEIAASSRIAGPAPAAQPQGMSALETAGDIGASGGIGLAKGTIGLAGLPGDVGGLLNRGIDWAMEKAGLPAPPAPPNYELGGSGQIQRGVEQVTGEFYKPKTTAGKYAQTVGEFVPGVIGGGIAGGLRKGAQAVGQYAVVPGVLSEYLGQQAEGTGYETPARIGGALAGVAAGRGIDPLVAALRNRVVAGSAAGQVSDIVGAPVGAGATRRVAESLAADRVTPASAAATRAELGPEAMLLDVGRQSRGRAEAIAAQPGRGQNVILDAVEERTGRFGAGTAARVEQTLNQEMGPARNVVELEKNVNEAVDRIARPLYRKVMDAHPVVSVPASIAERPAVAAAMKDARTLAKQYGEELATTETKTILAGPGYHIADDVTLPGKTSLKYWDYVKKDMDRRINSYMKSGGTSELNSADKADLGGLMDARRALVSHLDDVTNGAYKEARQASATKFELREALDFGRSAFNTKLLPEEFTAALSEMSVPERAMAQTGFRRELDRIIETTRNEGATARRVLDTNHVLQKSEALFGPQATREIERRIAAENTFQEAMQDIARNSRTAVRQQLIKDTSTPSASEVRGASLPGLAWAGVRGGLNYARQHGMERTRGQIADILASREIGPLVQTFGRYNTRRAQNMRPAGDPRIAVINALIAGQQGD
jgi:hypothetical protein